MMINSVNNNISNYQAENHAYLRCGKISFGQSTKALKVVPIETRRLFSNYIYRFSCNYFEDVVIHKNWFLSKFDKLKNKIGSFVGSKALAGFWTCTGPRVRTYAIMCGKKMVGGIHFHKSDLVNCAVCDTMFVDRKIQRTKDGIKALKMLIETLIAQCEQMKLSKIEWGTDSLHKNAMNLYKKLAQPSGDENNLLRFSVYIDELKAYLQKRKSVLDK